MNAKETVRMDLLRRKINEHFRNNPKSSVCVIKSDFNGEKVHWKVVKESKGIYNITEVNTMKKMFVIEEAASWSRGQTTGTPGSDNWSISAADLTKQANDPNFINKLRTHTPQAGEEFAEKASNVIPPDILSSMSDESFNGFVKKLTSILDLKRFELRKKDKAVGSQTRKISAGKVNKGKRLHEISPGFSKISTDFMNYMNNPEDHNASNTFINSLSREKSKITDPKEKDFLSKLELGYGAQATKTADTTAHQSTLTAPRLTQGKKKIRVKLKEKENIPGGLAKGKKVSSFNKKALIKGVKVEMEHTKDPKIAQEIAMDHLTEDPKYYDKLTKMEKESKVKTNTDSAIRKLFAKDSRPDDSAVHSLAKKLGMEVDDVEEKIYSMLGKKLKKEDKEEKPDKEKKEKIPTVTKGGDKEKVDSEKPSGIETPEPEQPPEQEPDASQNKSKEQEMISKALSGQVVKDASVELSDNGGSVVLTVAGSDIPLKISFEGKKVVLYVQNRPYFIRRG